MSLGAFIAGALLFGGGRSEHNHHHHYEAPRIDYDALGESTARHIVSCAYKEREKLIWKKLDTLYHEETRMHTTCGRCGQDIDLVEFRVSPVLNDISPFSEIPARGIFVFRCGCETKTIEHVFDTHPMIGAPLTYENDMRCEEDRKAMAQEVLDGRAIAVHYTEDEIAAGEVPTLYKEHVRMNEENKEVENGEN